MVIERDTRREEIDFEKEHQYKPYKIWKSILFLVIAVAFNLLSFYLFISLFEIMHPEEGEAGWEGLAIIILIAPYIGSTIVSSLISIPSIKCAATSIRNNRKIWGIIDLVLSIILVVLPIVLFLVLFFA